MMNDKYPLFLPSGPCPNLKYLLEYEPEEINNAFYCCGGTRLHHLVSMGLGEEVLQLLKKGADVDLQDQNGRTSLHVAVNYRYLSSDTKESVGPDIVKIIAQKTSDLNIMDVIGKTALHLAVSSANPEAVKILLQLGADIDFQDGIRNSPLHYAIDHSLDLVETLVKNGANVEVKNNKGETTLHKAVSAYQIGRMDVGQLINIISILLDKGSNINEQNKDGKTILHILGFCWGMHHNINELLTFLLNKGAQVHLQDRKGVTPFYLAIKQKAEFLGWMLRTESGKTAVNIPDNHRNYPLFLATKRRDFELVKLLLDNGAIIDIKNEYGETPLYLTLECGNISEPIFNLLIDRGAQVSCKDKYMRTPLHIACDRAFDQQKLICTTLLTKGASPNDQDATGMTPLHYAVKSNSKDIVQLLVENGAEVNSKNKAGKTPLHISTIYHSGGTDSLMRHLICSTLLEQGAIIDVQDRHGMTPLHNAVLCYNTSLVQLLLENGADVNSKNKNGETPLHVSTRQNRDSKTGLQELICKIVLGKGALPNAQDVYGKTPLHNAVKNHTTNIIQLLIENGSEVNKTNNKGETPLHLSTYRCGDSLQELTCSTLIAEGALINVQDNFGMTPLHNAVKGYTAKIVHLLLEKGAELNRKNKNGESSLQYVRSVDTLEVLLQRGSDVNEQNNYGRTVLHNIAKDYFPNREMSSRFKSILLYASSKVVKLLEWGASRNIRDILGKLPFDYYSFTDVQKEYDIKRTCLYSTFQKEGDSSNSYNIQKLHKSCCDEIDRMKIEILGHNSLYDIFRHYDDPNFLSNGDLESAVFSKDLKVKFPVYCSMLTSTYLRSRLRVQLFHHVVDILQTPLPFEVMRYILTFVDDDSLKNVIKAKEEPPAKKKTDTALKSETEPDLELNSVNEQDPEYESDWEYTSDSEYGSDCDLDSDSECGFYSESESDE